MSLNALSSRMLCGVVGVAGLEGLNLAVTCRSFHQATIGQGETFWRIFLQEGFNVTNTSNLTMDELKDRVKMLRYFSLFQLFANKLYGKDMGREVRVGGFKKHLGIPKDPRAVDLVNFVLKTRERRKKGFSEQDRKAIASLKNSVELSSHTLKFFNYLGINDYEKEVFYTIVNGNIETLSDYLDHADTTLDLEELFFKILRSNSANLTAEKIEYLGNRWNIKISFEDFYLYTRHLNIPIETRLRWLDLFCINNKKSKISDLDPQQQFEFFKRLKIKYLIDSNFDSIKEMTLGEVYSLLTSRNDAGIYLFKTALENQITGFRPDPHTDTAPNVPFNFAFDTALSNVSASSAFSFGAQTAGGDTVVDSTTTAFSFGNDTALSTNSASSAFSFGAQTAGGGTVVDSTPFSFGEGFASSTSSATSSASSFSLGSGTDFDFSAFSFK